MRIKDKKKGYMLVELVIVMALYTLVTVLLYNFLLYSIRFSNELKACTSGRAETGFAIFKISGEVREATNISIPSSDGGRVLIISTTQLNDHGIMEDVSIKYYLDSSRKRLYRMVNGTSNLLAENIQDLFFIHEGNVMRITITSSRQYNGRYYSAFSAVFPRVKV